MFLAMRYIFLIILGFCLSVSHVYGQLNEHLATEETRIDTSQTKTLGLRLNTLAFFHDNEFNSSLTKGYTLPGVRVTPALTYNPNQQIHLELGATALAYNGANKYPCYAYHDIATWKGDQYQKGFHVLPWVRAQVDFHHLSIILGNIYGGSNHHLIEPMYNAEQDLSTDPEMGFQLLLHRRRIELDTWMNWQSYIFETDSHQEAFTVGTNARLLWNDPLSRVHWYSPIQLTIQHRGGEQDTTSLGVQTLCNASLGVGIQYKPRRRTLTCIEGQANVVASLQENGSLWPFDTGMSIHAEGRVTLLNRLTFRSGYVGVPSRFATLYGTPLYSTLSVRSDRYHETFDGNHTTYAMIDYCHTIARHYTLGAQFQAYKSFGKELDDINYSFGIYLRLDPTIVLKRFK